VCDTRIAYFGKLGTADSKNVACLKCVRVALQEELSDFLEIRGTWSIYKGPASGGRAPVGARCKEKFPHRPLPGHMSALFGRSSAQITVSYRHEGPSAAKLAPACSIPPTATKNEMTGSCSLFALLRTRPNLERLTVGCEVRMLLLVLWVATYFG